MLGRPPRRATARRAAAPGMAPRRGRLARPGEGRGIEFWRSASWGDLRGGQRLVGQRLRDGFGSPVDPVGSTGESGGAGDDGGAGSGEGAGVQSVLVAGCGAATVMRRRRRR